MSVNNSVTLWLAGDVMLGRGIDQILPHPGDPTLRERFVSDARDYVALAAAASGSIPIPVDWSWPWGAALGSADSGRADVRILNLETSITTCSDFAAGKGIHYRMSPANLAALAAIQPDACVLANNHVLDFERAGLEETLDVLAAAGLLTLGAGRSAEEAQRALVLSPPAASSAAPRVVLLAFATPSSGTPISWAATPGRPGIHVVRRLCDAAAAQLGERVLRLRKPGDVVVVSAHWGSNWGYEVDPAQVRFAHRLIDAGVDIVYGHSSHHPRPIEVYRDKLILYGCGDLVNDYEGIRGHADFRPELRVAYLARVSAQDGRLLDLRLVPLRAHRLSLRRSDPAGAHWLRTALNEASRRFGTGLDITPSGEMALRWPTR